MATEKYSYSKFSLQFRSNEMELLYKDYILDHTIWFCRIAWGLIVFLGGSFAFLDQPFFGENAGKVLSVRLILISFSAIIFSLTFFPKLRRYLDWSSCLFILSVGIFCIFLTAMSDPLSFSPYFTGLLYAFTGIFTTAGLGFKYSFFALLINLVIFESALGFIWPIPFKLFVIYNFFLPSMLIIFAYIGYLVEIISRRNFVASSRLQDSLSQVRTLHGLIPICASCKSIRDDQGYWKQIELYVQDHSEAEFSHSVCPDCANRLYPELNI